MKRLSKTKLVGSLAAAMLIVAPFSGCVAPRTGKYFLSTREAAKRWGRASTFWGEPIGYLTAGFISIPTVVGPIYYWFIKPAYDTVDLALISPVFDVMCLPTDFYIRTWRRVKLHWVDEKGLPCAGVKLRLPTGSIQISNEAGNMDFVTWVKYANNRGPELLNKEYYKKSFIPLEEFREDWGDRFVPVTKVQEIRLRRKQKMSPCFDANIMMVVPEYGKPMAFDLFAKDWVAPYGAGVVTNILIETIFDNNLRTTIKLLLPDNNDGGFCTFGKVQGDDCIGLHEWKEWGENPNIERSACVIESLSGKERAFCISPKDDENPKTNSIYGVVKAIGVPWDLWSRGIPILFFDYRVNAPGANWFEWAEDYGYEVDGPRMFRAGGADVCDEDTFHLKDANGKDVWIKYGVNTRLKHYYSDPQNDASGNIRGGIR